MKKINIDTIPQNLTHIARRLSKTKPTLCNWVFFGANKKNDIIKRFLIWVDISEQDKFKNTSWLQWTIQHQGQVWILVGDLTLPQNVSHHGYLEDSSFTYWKHQSANYYLKMQQSSADEINCELVGLSTDAILGILVGIELSQYNYLSIHSQASRHKINLSRPRLNLFGLSVSDFKKYVSEAQDWGFGQNLARHLVNLPPGECYPEVVVQYIKHYFSKLKNVKIEVLDKARLEKENMGLLLGVGQGSEHNPFLVHLSYNPDKKNKKIQSVALVGKGVTFDTGGLDIKPSSGMRLMKKDMAGAAAVIGSLWYIANQSLPIKVDGYLPLAENAVDAKSMRPSDVLKARNGLMVEIHNTDAEGRLILADAIDYAVKQKTRPDALINVATLTGAIKTTLGLDIAGLFCNEDKLAQHLQVSSQVSGDLIWRIPLYNRYAANFSTPFADLVNAVDGWGSPITAALFLERFVDQVPWAHLDIYGWADRVSAIQSQAGGNGQGVGLINQYAKSISRH